MIETREDLVVFIEQLRLGSRGSSRGLGQQRSRGVPRRARRLDRRHGRLSHEPRPRLGGDPGLAALRDDAAGRGGVRIGARVRELEITPEPDDPAVAAAIARALEQLEREEGLTAPAPHERSRLGRGGAPRARRRWPRLTSSSAPGCTRPCGSRTASALHGERHLERITASAHALGLPAPGARGVRRGDRRRRRATARSCACGCTPRAARPSCAAERRAALAPEPVRADGRSRGWYAPGYLLREHKLTSHFHGVQGRRLAQAAGYDDALLVSHDGRVGEATNANVAFLARDVLVTPSVDGLLPGVCRAALLEAARGLGLAVEARPVALAELVDADGVLLTSSPRGLSEVVELDGRALRPHAAPSCSRRCARASPRRRAPTRWRYRDADDARPWLRAPACSRTPSRRAASSRRRRCARWRARAACCWSRARAAGRTSRRGPPPCSRGAIPPARWTRRARCSTAWPPTCRPARRPSRGGLLGSLGYDLARALEPIPQLARDDLGAAGDPAGRGRLALRLRPRARRAVDRRARRARAAAAARGPRARAPGRAARGARRRAARHAVRALPRARRARARPHRAAATSTRSTTRSGSRATVPSALDLYARLRETAPVPYNLYLDAGGWQLVGATPETFLRVSADGRCETRPIKGTRPRDDDPAARRGARRRSRDAPEGPRRERDDRRPRAQRPLARVPARHGARAVAVRGRVAPDGASARLDGDRASSPPAATRSTSSRPRSPPAR